jgi:salicylate hydroxylase
MVFKVDKWKLMYRECFSCFPSIKRPANICIVNEMEHWTNEKATVAFLGDACHPMLPYLAQGAGSSLEDGAALGKLLSGAKSSKDLPEVLQLYEALRKPRSSALQKTSVKQVSSFPSVQDPTAVNFGRRDIPIICQMDKSSKTEISY